MNNSRSYRIAAVLAATAGVLAIAIFIDFCFDRKNDSRAQLQRTGPTVGFDDKSGTSQDIDTSPVPDCTGCLSTVESSRLQAKITDLYGAATIEDLDRLAITAGADLAVDANALRWQAEMFCNMFTDVALAGRDHSFVDILSSPGRGETAGKTAAAHWLDQRREVFCTRGIDLVDHFSFDSEHLSASLNSDREGYQTAGLGVLQKAADMASEFEDFSTADMSVAERAELTEVVEDARASLLDVMATTNSPAAFRRAADLLSDGSILGRDWYPGGLDLKGRTRWIAETESAWRIAGSQLAFCRMVGSGCGANSLALLHSCLPGNCRPGETVVDFLRRTTSPQAMDAAQAYADALLALRQGKS